MYTHVMCKMALWHLMPIFFAIFFSVVPLSHRYPHCSRSRVICCFVHAFDIFIDSSTYLPIPGQVVLCWLPTQSDTLFPVPLLSNHPHFPAQTLFFWKTPKSLFLDSPQTHNTVIFAAFFWEKHPQLYSHTCPGSRVMCVQSHCTLIFAASYLPLWPLVDTRTIFPQLICIAAFGWRHNIPRSQFWTACDTWYVVPLAFVTFTTLSPQPSKQHTFYSVVFASTFLQHSDEYITPTIYLRFAKNEKKITKN